MKPEVAVKPRLDVALDERREHEDPPEAEDHARDRGKQLHERPDHSAYRLRREHAQEEADRYADRGGEQQRHERAHRGAKQEVDRAKGIEVGRPAPVNDEAQAELRKRQVRSAEHLVANLHDRRERE